MIDVIRQGLLLRHYVYFLYGSYSKITPALTSDFIIAL